MKVRPIGDADWPRLETFARKHFGFSHIPNRQFHEHWFRNPWGEGWGGRVLERPDGTLAGALMVIVLPGWFAGRETTLGYLSSGVVEEDARQRGQGAALYLWAYRTFPLVLAMGGNANSAPLNDLMGEAIPGVALRRFLRLNRAACLNLCRPEDRPAVDARPQPRAVPPAGVWSCWVADVPADYDRLWRTVREGIVCSVDRTAAYVRWRSRAPFMDYRILEVRRDDRLIGLAVCRNQETPAGPVVRVIEMIAGEADAGAVWSALAAATGEALFVDFMVVGTGQDAALAGAGFLEANDKSGLDLVPHLLSPVEHRQWSATFTLGGALAQDDASWRRPDALYLTKGDGDRDWPTLFDLERLGLVA